MPTTLWFFRRNLPHWLVADRSYFVTIRLHGTLPRNVVEEMRAERKRLEGVDAAEVNQLQRQQFVKLEKILDSAGQGSAWLGDAKVAALVIESLGWLRKKGWRIYAAVVMSNHVHMLMRSETGCSAELLDDLGHFKRYTARQANILLGREGQFWAREDFDHWIRDRAKFEGTIRYILNNPVKAGLVGKWQDWPWCCLDESIRELV